VGSVARPEGTPVSSVDQTLRIVFSGAASLISAAIGYGYHWVHYHNNVEHMHMALPQITVWVTTVAPWVFLIPPAVLIAGLIWRRHSLVVLLAVHIGWLFAVTWVPLCLWAWAVPETLLLMPIR